tara:strand:+ start:1751 stop:2173 length:423 start_codon:yes stop_codon:yes gene_type:complete
MEIVVVVIEYLFSMLDKKTLFGFILGSIPFAVVWVTTKFFVRKKELEQIKTTNEICFSKLNEKYIKLDMLINNNMTEVKNELTLKVSKKEMHEYLDEVKEEIDNTEAQLEKLLGAVSFIVQKNGGSLEDVLILNKKEGVK